MSSLGLVSALGDHSGVGVCINSVFNLRKYTDRLCITSVYFVFLENIYGPWHPHPSVEQDNDRVRGSYQSRGRVVII